MRAKNRTLASAFMLMSASWSLGQCVPVILEDLATGNGGFEHPDPVPGPLAPCMLNNLMNPLAYWGVAYPNVAQVTPAPAALVGLNFSGSQQFKFPNTMNPPAFSGALNERYVAFHIQNPAASYVPHNNYVLQHDMLSDLEVGASYRIRFRYCAYRYSGTGTPVVRLGFNFPTVVNCPKPIVSPPVHFVQVSVTQTSVPTGWQTYEHDFVATTSGTVIQVFVQTQPVTFSGTTAVRFFIDQIELIRETCPGDFDCDGLVTVYDVLPFVAAGGQNTDDIPIEWTFADFNGDGIIGTNDYNYFVTLIGLGDCGDGMVQEPGDGGLTAMLAQRESSALPNPGTGVFRIDHRLPGEGPIDLVVLDHTGREIHRSSELDRTYLDLDITHESAGVYTAMVHRAGKFTALRLVKE